MKLRMSISVFLCLSALASAADAVRSKRDEWIKQ